MATKKRVANGTSAKLKTNLKRIYATHSARSRAMDSSRANKRNYGIHGLTAAQIRRWSRDIGTMDLRGVDTKRKTRKRRR